MQGVSLNSASTATHTLDLLQRSKEHERGIDHVDADFVVRLIKQAWAALRAGPAAGLRAVFICDDWSMLATLLQDDSAQVLSVFAAVLDMVRRGRSHSHVHFLRTCSCEHATD